MAHQNIEVARDQLALGEYAGVESGVDEDLQAPASETVTLFDRLISVADRADEYTAGRSSSNLPRQHFGGIHFSIHEPSPRLFMPRKALHEPGIAIDTAVSAADVAVHTVVGDTRLGEHRFRQHFPLHGHEVDYITRKYQHFCRIWKNHYRMLEEFKYPPVEYRIAPVPLVAEERFQGTRGANRVTPAASAVGTAGAHIRPAGEVQHYHECLDQVFAPFLDVAEQAACGANLSLGAYSTVFWKLVSSSAHTAGRLRVQSELSFENDPEPSLVRDEAPG